MKSKSNLMLSIILFKRIIGKGIDNHLFVLDTDSIRNFALYSGGIVFIKRFSDS